MPREMLRGAGTGFLISPNGYVVTNAHVVEDAASIEVRLLDDDTPRPAKVIGMDKTSDVALIKIDGTNLPVIPLGNSDEMDIGDRVLAVGAPYGLTGSVTSGIISAKSRNLKLNVYEDFLQTDAAINPGNSGGPLVNLDGRLIGINSAIKSRSGGFQGVGLAISSNLVKAVMQQLLKDGVKFNR